ncbi:MAG: DUF805 domain-containing protein [SAR202 cluster bacterium]|nr:DUF805 domain-containing protein [SAR202 cluster bacterium]MDP6713308.1 DUF805 domain-containing protein [SAR202 cluster bacterium]
MVNISDSNFKFRFSPGDVPGLFTRVDGRIWRSELWIGILVVLVGDVVGVGILLLMHQMADHSGYGLYLLLNVAAILSIPIILSLNLILFTLLLVGRSHDRDHSAVYPLLLLVPVIGFYVLIELLFFKSAPETNRYGSRLTSAGRGGPDAENASRRHSNSQVQAVFPDKLRIEDVPALVYLFPEDWAAKKSFTTADYHRLKLSYHDEHHDKRQLTVAALFALFVEMHRAREIEFRSKNQSHGYQLDVRLIVDSASESDDIHGKLVAALPMNRWTPVRAAVASILPGGAAYVWDAYVRLIDHEVTTIPYFDSLFDDEGWETPVWDAAGDMSVIIHQDCSKFASKNETTFRDLWEGIAKGISSGERGVKGAGPSWFSPVDLFL